jgi:hypothetical protein
MLSRRNEFGRGRSRWGHRDIFVKRRRRFPWVSILLVAALAAGAYTYRDPGLRGQIETLWAEIRKPALTPEPDPTPPPAPLPVSAPIPVPAPSDAPAPATAFASAPADVPASAQAPVAVSDRKRESGEDSSNLLPLPPEPPGSR